MTTLLRLISLIAPPWCDVSTAKQERPVLLTDVKREQRIEGMAGIIRRMCRLSAGGLLVLADYDERELSIKLLAYLEGRDVEIEK
ncbi:hypothetical protein OEG84_24980 [Hoeflea sp. G2-23]|uniref:Uncharacterized protein n=1 Tax=Hoeflea algicola TaxID=2983763 RepID=A0ABT3Z305_9HYPH|nr:hypothetical protein [Hoeflea algicola]MCY0146153.1 hypothetical protein [Hoeflea algicola]MCY0150862.1 hypothetical protein [Hoeflea algicola]